MKGKRDRALLAVLVGCGLRRKEAALLSVEHIQLREARWVIVDLERGSFMFIYVPPEQSQTI